MKILNLIIKWIKSLFKSHKNKGVSAKVVQGKNETELTRYLKQHKSKKAFKKVPAIHTQKHEKIKVFNADGWPIIIAKLKQDLGHTFNRLNPRMEMIKKMREYKKEGLARSYYMKNKWGIRWIANEN